MHTIYPKCNISHFQYYLDQIGWIVCRACFGGPQQVFPEGPPSVDFAIDSGVGMGIVYILSILIRYLSIQLSILLFNMVQK